MSPEQFAYWLQGFAELNPQAPTQEQWALIREHLGTVFNKATPRLGEIRYTPLGVPPNLVQRDNFWNGLPKIIC